MLRFLNIPFKTVVPKLPEKWEKSESAEKAAVRLASEKLFHITGRKGLMIAMDTIVAIGNLKLGKPENSREAIKMLGALSGRMHRVITGIALKYEGKIVTDYEATQVYFRKMRPEELRWYANTKEPFDKAGAYAIQGKGRLFIRKIDGCYFNVIGFPIFRFQECLKKFGLEIYDLMKSIRS
jgi:septum formation protein